MLTLDELVGKLLQNYDMLDILEVLQITSEEILDHFDYKIEALGLYDKLNEELGDE